MSEAGVVLEFLVDYFKSEEKILETHQMKCACGEFANVWEGKKKECTGCYLKPMRGNNK